VAVEDVPEAPAFGGGGAARASEAVLTGKESPEQLDQLVANRKPFSPPDPGVVRRAQVKVRIDEDVEDMTFGMVNGEPNNFTFKEGFVYEVPIALADHLESRGLVRQWVG
jgi:hypothetical protein